MGKLDIDELEKKLASKEMSAEELRGIAAEITPLGRFDPSNVFPIGIVDPDAVRVRVTVPSERIAQFATELSTFTDPVIRSWRIFPIGIINPERFEVDVDIGRPFG